MIKYLPIKPIQLAFLLTLLYYFCFEKVVLCLILLLLALLFLWQQYGWKAWCQVSLCLAFFAIFFLTKANQTEQVYQATEWITFCATPTTVEQDMVNLI